MRRYIFSMYDNSIQFQDGKRFVLNYFDKFSKELFFKQIFLNFIFKIG